MTIRKMSAKHPELASPALFGKLAKRISDVMSELTGDTTDKPYGIRKGPGAGHYCKADQAK